MILEIEFINNLYVIKKLREVEKIQNDESMIKLIIKID